MERTVETHTPSVPAAPKLAQRVPARRPDFRWPYHRWVSITRWIVLDVGETLIDETRFWAAWADELGISRLTFMAGLGAVIARGGEYLGVFDLFGITGWRDLAGAVEARHGGFTAADLYPDAAPALGALHAAGYRIAITANQPAIRDAQLRALGIVPDVMAMSEAMGVSKPNPAFFARTLQLLGDPPPGRVAYVGDRIDNDVLPAIRAGMRPVWLRRGPWGRIQAPPADAAGVLVVGSLAELVDRVGEVWADDGGPPGLAGQASGPDEASASGDDGSADEASASGDDESADGEVLPAGGDDGSAGEPARSAGGVRPASR